MIAINLFLFCIYFGSIGYYIEIVLIVFPVLRCPFAEGNERSTGPLLFALESKNI